MTFIDKDTGAEYEEVENDYISMDGRRVIRPVKKPKWEVDEPTRVVDDSREGFVINTYVWSVREDQAQLIKDCVQELMESLDTDMPRYSTQKLIAKIEQARQATKGLNDEFQ